MAGLMIREDISTENKSVISDKRLLRLRRSNLTETAQCQGFRVSFACDQNTREKSFKLTYQRYREVGLIEGLPGGMWYTIFHALPSSTIAVALLEDKDNNPISTSTLIVDDKVLGLPSDSLYKDKIDNLRDMGRKVAEVSCLAALPYDKGQNAFLHVFRMIGLYSIYKGIDDLIISIHPKHRSFYELMLLFEPLEEKVRYYPYLKDAPAVLEHLDMRTAPQKYIDTYSKYPKELDLSLFMLGPDRIYLKEPNLFFKDLECLEPMTFNEFYYFFVEKKPIWQELDRDKKVYFEELYPGLTEFISRKMTNS